jgi:hypothetical protein
LPSHNIVFGASDGRTAAAPTVPAPDPMTGRRVAPLMTAALRVKPCGQMTIQQIGIADVLRG